MTHVGGPTNANSEIKFKAPDGGWGWIIVISSFLIHMIMDGITYSLGTYLTLFTEDFGVSHGAASIIHSLLPAVTLSCGPIASIFTNRYGCRNTTILGSLIGAFGFIISFWVKKFYVLYFTVGIVVGFGFGLIYVPAIVSVGYYFEKYRAVAMGIAVCGTGVGTFALSPLNRILTEKYGWEGAFLIKAAFVLNGCVCGAVMRPVPIEPSELLKQSKKQAKKHQKKEKLNEPRTPDKKALIQDGKVPTTPQILITPPNEDQRIEKSVYSQDHINLNTLEHNDPTAFAKSLPVLHNNSVKHPRNRSRQLNQRSQLSIKTAYSSMDILAATRSLQAIKVSTSKIEADINDDEVEEPKTLFDKINKYIDLTIFLDIIFVYFAISNFLTSLGFNAPYIYIVDQAIKLGIDSDKADWLLSTIGISNTVGRIALGLIADVKGVNRLYLYSTVLTIAGIATIIEPFFTSYIGLMAYSVIFGFNSGGYVSITSILLVDLLGLDKLTNAFGILLVFQGIATAIGPPTVGFMYDAFGTYHFPFIFTGTMIAISGGMCYFIPCFKSYKRKVQNEKENVNV